MRDLREVEREIISIYKETSVRDSYKFLVFVLRARPRRASNVYTEYIYSLHPLSRCARGKATLYSEGPISRSVQIFADVHNFDSFILTARDSAMRATNIYIELHFKSDIYFFSRRYEKGETRCARLCHFLASCISTNQRIHSSHL